jgi:predicted phosphodiesterase
MGHYIKTLIYYMLLSPLIGCEDVDFTGMFIPVEPVNQRFRQSMEWNALHPFEEIVVPSDNYLILSMSDSHVGSTTNLNRFLNSAATTNASAAVMVGDLTTGHSYDYDAFQQCIPSQDSLHTFFLTGNHDLFFNGWHQFYTRFGSSTYLFTVKTPVADDLYICLDSGNATLGDKQLDWLIDILETSRNDYRYCVVFTHNNFFRNRHTGSTNPLVEELLVLMELFTIHHVDLVITGHDHKKYVEQFGNTAYITMDALMDGLDYSGYLSLLVENGKIDYRFINFN